MAQKKKLQVFISSTYTDLQEERQAAVQAILTAGHIPAGMELFAAGDETQMNVIKRWIDESDVYMLILGGRYGSIESKSQKSYIHLEYEYALEKGKPLFAVVIDETHLEEKVKKDGFKVIEKDHTEKLKVFRELVCSKMVRFWKDTKDIKLSILETMAEFSERPVLTGWIPGNESINSGVIAEELARLTKENLELREKITNSLYQNVNYNGLSYLEMRKLLNSIKVDSDKFSATGILKTSKDMIENIKNYFGDSETTLLHYLWMMSSIFNSKIHESVFQSGCVSHILNKKLHEFGVIMEVIEQRSNSRFDNIFLQLTDDGKRFLVRLRLEDNISRSEEWILKL